MKRIGIVTNAAPDSGVGVRAYEIAKRITGNAFNASVVSLMAPASTFIPKSIGWLYRGRSIPTFDIYDFSNQTLSFLASKRRPSVVTVHDIIELTDPQDARASLLNRYLLSGIRKADLIVAVSEYTKRAITQYFDISESRIRVIPNGVSSSYTVLPDFRNTIGYQQLTRELGITPPGPVILSVGSEHPRKNLDTALATIALLKKTYPTVLFIKVGNPGIASGRTALLERIDQLNIRDNVKILGNVPSERLNELYNSADVFLFPSLLEGFGMPSLEAMAAGCPVVCSNATSIPEVVGGAALLHEATNAQAFAHSIQQVITDSELRSSLRAKGQARAAQFSWDTAARDMMQVYKQLL